MSLSLEILGGQQQFSPGEEIEVLATWDLTRAPDAIELRMVWHTSGKGDRDMQVVKTVEIGSPAAIGEQRLAIFLPRSPYSFSGKLISLEWGLELVARPGKESDRVDIVIGPGRQEVLIGAANHV